MENNAGEIVELAVRRSNVNISELSRQLRVNRRTMYNWFGQKKLHTDVIFEIGKAIDHDFSFDFEGGLGFFKEPNFSKQEVNSDHSKTVYYWMEKYINLLEDYRKLEQKVH